VQFSFYVNFQVKECDVQFILTILLLNNKNIKFIWNQNKILSN
jgi:hypothetical protein